MIGVQNYPNIAGPDSDYPNGRMRDRTLSQSGTPANMLTNSDYQQFFEKMMRMAYLTPNGLPDNEYTGFQTIEALRTASLPYTKYFIDISQTGTNDPTGNIFENNVKDPSSGILINIVWTRTGIGEYQGVGGGALFNPNRTKPIIASFENGGTGPGNITIQILPIGPSFYFQINTVDGTNTPIDGVLNKTPLEIRRYETTSTPF